MYLDWQLTYGSKSYLQPITPPVCVNRCVCRHVRGLSAIQSFTACVKEKNSFDPLPHMVKHSPPDSASFQTAARGEKTEGGGASESPCCEKKKCGTALTSPLSLTCPQELPWMFFFYFFSFISTCADIRFLSSYPLCVLFFTLILWLNPSVSLSISTLLQQWEILQNP